MSTQYKCGLLEIVQKKYQLPYWIFMEQFRDDTGFNAISAADGLAVGMYRSRGQELIGFEVKRSRADWLRELRNPNKAECIARFCDKWYVVIPKQEKAIVNVEELGTWGLITVGEKRAEYTKEASQLQPAPIERFFLAAIVKQALDVVKPPPEDTARVRKSKAWQDGFEAGKLTAGHDADSAAKLQQQVREFEEASGLHLWAYADVGKTLGEHVRFVRESKNWHERYIATLSSLQDRVNELSSGIAEQLGKLEKFANEARQPLLPGIEGGERLMEKQGAKK